MALQVGVDDTKSDKAVGEIVSIVRCDDYDQNNVARALRENIANLGGLDRFVPKGARVFLKVNLLRAARPEAAITTHPAVVSGLAKLLVDYGASVVVGDSPGAGTPYNERSLRHVYRTSGLLDSVPAAGAELNYDTETVSVSVEAGQLIKRVSVIKPVMEADVVISVAKAKTHDYMLLTGAVKNLFGVIPGFEKPGYHAKLRDPRHFANMLIDLCELVRPRLSFLDAITCMEGNGPAFGELRAGNLLMASSSPYCLDLAFCQVAGLEYLQVPLLKEAADRDLLPDAKDIAWKGVPIGTSRIDNFRLPDTAGLIDGFENGTLLVKLARPFLKNMCSVKPVVRSKTCKDCGICGSSCPVSAIDSVDSAALIDDKKCIRCYCCHELCPHDSIDLKKSLAYSLMERLM